MRRERDSVGSINVPASRYWGAGTQRALNAFPGSDDGMPERFFRSYGYVKRAIAMMHAQAGRLPIWKTMAISRAADDLIAGRLADQFPLSVWQSGSGRDADSNVNEVLANRAAQLLGAAVGSREPIDPARDVNMGQSLDGTFTASMYLATVIEIEEGLVPRCGALARAIARTPNALSGDDQRLRLALGRLDEAEGSLHELGADPGEMRMTGDDWRVVVGTLAADTARPFIVAPIGLPHRASVDAMVAAMAAVRGLALVLLDIAETLDARDTDGRGVRQGLTGVTAMACRYVVGLDQVVATAVAGRGNAPACGGARPLIVASVLKSLLLLGDGCDAMRRLVASGR